MKEEKFKIIDFIRNLIIYIDKELDNFPKKDIEIKKRIRNASFDLLELSYQANNTSIKEKKIELVETIIAKLKTIDFLLNLSYEKEIISNKKYLKFGEKINDITRYTVGWKNSIKF